MQTRVQSRLDFLTKIDFSANVFKSKVALFCSKSKVADKSSTPSTTDNVSEATSSVSKLCTFCGRSIHARSMCPAKNAVCFKCQRRGHFANVCKSKVFKNINARVSSSTLCVIHETPNCLTKRA